MPTYILHHHYHLATIKLSNCMLKAQVRRKNYISCTGQALQQQKKEKRKKQRNHYCRHCKKYNTSTMSSRRSFRWNECEGYYISEIENLSNGCCYVQFVSSFHHLKVWPTERVNNYNKINLNTCLKCKIQQEANIS